MGSPPGCRNGFRRRRQGTVVLESGLLIRFDDFSVGLLTEKSTIRWMGTKQKPGETSWRRRRADRIGNGLPTVVGRALVHRARRQCCAPAQRLRWRRRADLMR